ncbi:hypothetical protein HI914_00870 [Erysiphe necator]|nr:hypothetical protein HI914_00870 [Erysiphe necator]
MDIITARITPQITVEPNTDRILAFLTPGRPNKPGVGYVQELVSDDDEELSDIPEEFADDGGEYEDNDDDDRMDTDDAAGPSTSSRPTSKGKRIASITEIQSPKRRTTRRTNPSAGDD